jgi:serine/threonine protein kinase
MSDKIGIRREAVERQGSVIQWDGAHYLVEGDQKRARFQIGEEGLVHCAVEQFTGTKYRIKCFWEPDHNRLERLRFLVDRGLGKLKDKSADVLAGAPFDIIPSMGPISRFASIMKSVEGESWKEMREFAVQSPAYPPPDWPTLRIRLLCAYRLASAVELMESIGFVHADLSEGNLIVVPDGDRSGRVALVDFDSYFNSKYPSRFLGTSGFVAPEIWTRGQMGIGSDRVAMAILIQDLLLVGDRRLKAEDVVNIKYTQEQILAKGARAHALIKERYHSIAVLLEQTLRAPTREQRPHPRLWRQALDDIQHHVLGMGPTETDL